MLVLKETWFVSRGNSNGIPNVDNDVQAPQEGGDSDWAEDVTQEDEDSAGEDSVSLSAIAVLKI